MPPKATRKPAKRKPRPAPAPTPAPKSQIPQWVLLALGGLITLVWVVSMAVRMLSPNYPVPPVADALMLAFATFAFGKAVLRNENGK